MLYQNLWDEIKKTIFFFVKLCGHTWKMCVGCMCVRVWVIYTHHQSQSQYHRVHVLKKKVNEPRVSKLERCNRMLMMARAAIAAAAKAVAATEWKKPTLCFELRIWNGSKMSWHILVVNANSFSLLHLFAGVYWALCALSSALCCVLSTNDSERNHHLICFCSEDYEVFACCSQMIHSRSLHLYIYLYKYVRTLYMPHTAHTAFGFYIQFHNCLWCSNEKIREGKLTEWKKLSSVA